MTTHLDIDQVEIVVACRVFECVMLIIIVGNYMFLFNSKSSLCTFHCGMSMLSRYVTLMFVAAILYIVLLLPESRTIPEETPAFDVAKTFKQAVTVFRIYAANEDNPRTITKLRLLVRNTCIQVHPINTVSYLHIVMLLHALSVIFSLTGPTYH